MYIYKLIANTGYVYIGKAKNLSTRIAAHNKNPAFVYVDYVEYILVDNVADVDILEAYWINHYQPKHNKEFKISIVSNNFVLPEQYEDVVWTRIPFRMGEWRDSFHKY